MLAPSTPLPETGTNAVGDEALEAGSSYVDVRDLAQAHVKAIQKEKAAGERIIISV